MTAPNPQQSVPDATPTAAKRRRPALRKLGVAGLALWTLVVGGAGFVGGWVLMEGIQAGRVSEGPEVIEIPAAVEVLDQTMLDVRGMTLADAKQALADTGLPLDGLEAREVAWSGEAGVIISQDPVAGQQTTGGIVFQVSVTASMPEIVGRLQREVIPELKALGVEVEVEERYELASPTGTVLEADIAAGEPLPAVVTITVAQAGGSVFLSELAPVEGSCRSGAAAVNAVPMPNSLSCGPGYREEGSTTVYLLNRRARLMSGTLGVDDTGPADAAVHVVITGDGKPLAEGDITYANPVPFTIDVTGVLRLEIIVSSTNRSDAVLGEVLVKGATNDIAQLELRQ